MESRVENKETVNKQQESERTRIRTFEISAVHAPYVINFEINITKELASLISNMSILQSHCLAEAER